jgi:hypothetical protein
MKRFVVIIIILAVVAVSATARITAVNLIDIQKGHAAKPPYTRVTISDDVKHTGKSAFSPDILPAAFLFGF